MKAVLLSGANVRDVVKQMLQQFAGADLMVQEHLYGEDSATQTSTRLDDRARNGGVSYLLAEDRLRWGAPTNSSVLMLAFLNGNAHKIETNDDPLLEWSSDTSLLTITIQQRPRGLLPNPLRQIVIAKVAKVTAA